MKSLAAIFDKLWLKLGSRRNAKGQLRLNEKSVFVVAVAIVFPVAFAVGHLRNFPPIRQIYLSHQKLYNISLSETIAE